jgi:hypothetical protein
MGQTWKNLRPKKRHQPCDSNHIRGRPEENNLILIIDLILISVCWVILEGVHVCRWILSFFSWFIYYLISSVAACTKNGSMCLLNAQRKQVRPILYNNITYT